MTELRSRYRWSYGVITVPKRRDDLLPRTLSSLAKAGFDKPRLFVDGAQNREGEWWESTFNLEVTTRFPFVRTHGNWVLSIYELFIRNPNAEVYALFQDDLIAYRNLKYYLERSPHPFPEKGYLNLFTFPVNQRRFPRIGQTGRFKIGWQEGIAVGDHPSQRHLQAGYGAVGLVFSREGLLNLLSHRHLTERPMDCDRGWRAVDGGIVTAMNKSGFRELVHSPSLIQHTGEVSVMGNNPHQAAEGWRGENFDALDLLKEMKDD